MHEFLTGIIQGVNSVAFLKDPEDDFTPNLTPLVDVVFLLIIFFLVTTEFLPISRQFKIALPESEYTEESLRTGKNILEIDETGILALNGKLINQNQLKKALGSLDPQRPFLIRADKKTPYGMVVQIMGICRNLGFPEVDASVIESP